MSANQEFNIQPNKVKIHPMFDRLEYRYKQNSEMASEFGLLKTLKCVYGRFMGEKDEEFFELENEDIKYPLMLRQTHSDLWGYIEVFRHGAYDLPVDLTKKINGKAIVDLGAYNGTSAVYFANKYPKSEIIAVEPNPKNYSLLCKNTAPYGKHIKTINSAVSPTDHSIIKQPLSSNKRTFGLKSNNMLNTYLPSHEKSSNNLSAVTPDRIVKLLSSKVIGLLKVDIEGAEKQLFESKEIDKLLRITDILLIETHDKHVKDASLAVRQACTRNGLKSIAANMHTDTFIKGSLI